MRNLIILKIFVVLALLFSGINAERCNILIYSNADDWHYSFDSLAAVFEGWGNTVALENRSTLPNLNSLDLTDFSQIWFINGESYPFPLLTTEEAESLQAFARAGGGLSVLADHSPGFATDANLIVAFWNINFNGYRAHGDGGMFCDSLVSFTDHPVSQAVNFISTNLSEGKISFTGAPALFDVIALDWAGADQDTILAAYQEDSAKVFLDASFVRYMSDRVPLCDHLQLYCNILKWLEPSGCYCFDDCPPAYARVLCPLPDESYSSCITQGATFLVKDTTGLLIDTMRVYFTVTILNRHHGYDTLYSLHEPSADLRFQDETLAVVSGFWSDEDKVTVNIDSAYTTTDCFTNFTDTCECYQNTDCLSPKFCQKATGDCLGCGECASRPEACFDFWDPVCGCDGNTYSNECYAHASGVNVAYRGVCSE